MNLWLIILLAVFVVPGLSVAAALLWIGTSAMWHGRAVTQEAALTIASLRRILRSVYRDTVGESLPDDIVDLLRKLGPTPAGVRVREGF
ncbi:MAG: hypothetical protein H0V46_01640 [Sphingomonas sp.]|nr:hypothetical protein [Sphingomonas sp.]